MDFTYSAEAAEQLHQHHADQLLAMAREVSVYGHISLESQQALSNLPAGMLEPGEGVNLSLETIAANIKSTLRTIVQAVVKIWRKALEWLSALFSRKRQQAEQTHANWEKAEDTHKHFEEALRQYATGKSAQQLSREKFAEVLNKHQANLTAASNGLTDDLMHRGLIADCVGHLKAAVQVGVKNFDRDLGDFNDVIKARALEDDHSMDNESWMGEIKRSGFNGDIKLNSPGSNTYSLISQKLHLDKDANDVTVITELRMRAQHLAAQRATHPLGFKDFHWGRNGQVEVMQATSAWFTKEHGGVEAGLKSIEARLRTTESIRDQSVSTHVRNALSQQLQILRHKLQAIQLGIALLSDMANMEHHFSVLFKNGYTEAATAAGWHPDSTDAKTALFLHRHQ